MTRRICVVTGTRAEFGLLRWLMGDLKASDGVKLQVVATGMHLSPEFGSTYQEIVQAGFAIDIKVETLLSSDTAAGVSKSIGLGLIGFAEAYERLAPHIVVVLGDRFEIFAAAAAALIAGIPVAHLHGGETTQGAFDEALRHSITKMSHMHFVATEDYRRRVVQLGEEPGKVFLVGGLGVDAICRMDLMSKESLEASINFKLGPRNLLVTFHPVTLEGEASSTRQMSALLDALDELKDIHLIFTMPNADTGGRALKRLVTRFVATRKNAKVYDSLGQLRYVSCMKYVDAVVGNSSSGLTEAPSMGTGTINIGSRQAGRLQSTGVINCLPSREAILAAIDRLYEPDFQLSLAAAPNPYGDGGASQKILRILKEHPLDGILIKRFHDLPL